MWEEDTTIVITIEVRNALPGDYHFVCDTVAELPL